MKYDVVIGGSGPAGSVSAFLLAKQGVRTLLVEKEALPRYKPCGGGIPLKTMQLFPFDISPTYELQADGAVVNYQGTFYSRLKFDQPYGWLVMRDRFDHFLAEQATQAGADLMEETTITGVQEHNDQVDVQTSRGTIHAQYLIGADGVNSSIAHSLGLIPNRTTGAAIEAEITVPYQAAQELGNFITFDFGAIPGGYGWIFPKRDHLSIGVFQANNQKSPGFRQKLTAYIEMNPILKEHNVLMLRGHRIPLGGAKIPLHTQRVILVGDAANLADAWLGEGIFYAVKSARIASEVIFQMLGRTETNLAVYTQRVHQEISRQLKFAKKIASFIYRFPKAASLMTAKSEIMQYGICTTVYGQTNNEQLYKTMLLKSAKILFQTIR